MALSHKNLELTNSWIWLAETDIDRDLDRHLDQYFEVKKLQTKMQNHWLFSSNNSYLCKWQKADEKKRKEDEQNLEWWLRTCVQTSLRSVCTYDLGQDSPIQTSCLVNKS